MSKKELEVLKVAELVSICKEKGICHCKGKRRLTKEELVNAIVEKNKEENFQPVADAKEVPFEPKEETAVGQEKPKKKLIVNVSQLPGTPKYLDKIEVGNLVAFKESSGRLNTAMVKNASFKRRQLRLETKYGKEFVVSFDDVIWVKTKDRWPRFVLDILKQQQRGRKKDGKSLAGQEEGCRTEAASN